MSGATVLAGAGGAVVAQRIIGGASYLVARIKQWNATISCLEAAWGDSDSGGATNRVGGREDMTGTITGVPDMDNPQHNNFLFGGGSNPNDKNIVALLLWEDANEGLTAEDYWYLPRALISQLTWGIDNDTKLPMDWTANFGADSLFYRPRQVGTMPTATAATILNEGLPVGTTPA